MKRFFIIKKLLKFNKAHYLRNHPGLAGSYHNMGVICQSMQDYSKACEYVKCAVEIGQISLQPDHPLLKTYKDHLGYISGLNSIFSFFSDKSNFELPFRTHFSSIMPFISIRFLFIHEIKRR